MYTCVYIYIYVCSLSPAFGGGPDIHEWGCRMWGVFEFRIFRGGLSGPMRACVSVSPINALELEFFRNNQEQSIKISSIASFPVQVNSRTARWCCTDVPRTRGHRYCVVISLGRRQTKRILRNTASTSIGLRFFRPVRPCAACGFKWTAATWNFADSAAYPGRGLHVSAESGKKKHRHGDSPFIRLTIILAACLENQALGIDSRKSVVR